MSNGKMTFSVVLEAVTAAFNKAVKDAGANYSAATNGIRSDSAGLQANTEAVSSRLKDIFASKDSAGLVASLKAATSELNNTKQGAQLTADQLRSIGTSSKAAVAELTSGLRAAQAEMKLLQATKATPADLAAAKAKVEQLSKAVLDAQASYARFQTAASTAMRRAATDTGEAAAKAQAAGRAIYEALNIKTGGALRTEIAQLTTQLQQFKASSGAPAAEIERVSRAAQTRIKELRAEMAGITPSSTNALSSIRSIGQGALALTGVTVGLAAIKAGIEEILTVTVKFEQVNKQLEFATGSAAKGAAEFEFVKTVAKDLGLELLSTASGYAKLAASTKGTALEGEATRKVFQGVAAAAASLGLSADDTNGVMTALAQIASKGQVSMEELRQQLGERLPGAMAVAAKSMGVTTGELIKLIEGGLDSVTFLRAFGPAMVDAFGPTAQKNAQSLQGQMNALKNTFNLLLNDLGQGAIGKAAAVVFGDIALAIGATQKALNSLDPSTVKAATEVFRQLYNIVGDTFTTLMTLVTQISSQLGDLSNNLSGFLGSFISGTEGATEKVGFLTRTMQGLSIAIGFIRDGISALPILFNLVQGASERWLSQLALGLSKVTLGDLSASLKQFAVDMDASAKGSFARAEAQALSFKSAAGEALARTAEASEATGTRLGTAIAAGAATAAASTVAIGESAQASFRKAEAAANEASTTFTNAGGQIVEVMHGTAKAGTEVIDAFRDIAKEVGLTIPPSVKTTGELGQALAEVANKSTRMADLIAKSIPDAIKKLNGPELREFQNAFIGALEKAGASSAKLERAILDINTTAAKSLGVDLAATLNKVSREFTDSRVTLDGFIQDFDRLKATGVNANLLIEQSLRSMLDKAKNPAEVQALVVLFQTLGKEGKISGQAMAEGIQQAKTKIDQLVPGINSLAEAFKTFGLSTREESRLTADYLKQAFDVMKASGQATTGELRIAFTKYAEQAVTANKGVVDSQIAVQAAMLGLKVEVDETGKVIVSSMTEGKKAVDGIATSFGNATQEVQKQVEAMDRLNMKYKLQADYSEAQLDILEKDIALRERRIDIQNKQNNVDKNGFSLDKAGATVGALGETWISIVNSLKQMGVGDQAAAERIAREFTDAQGNVQYFNNPGQKKYGADTLSLGVQRAATQYMMNANAPKMGDAGTGSGARTLVEFKGPKGESATLATTPGSTVEGVMAVLRSAGATAVSVR
jgi:tape measure domain-containing protein